MKRILFSCVMIASALSFFSCKDEPEGNSDEWVDPYTFATIKDAREFWKPGLKWIASGPNRDEHGRYTVDEIEMVNSKIAGKSYLRMLRNGQPTNIYIRVERERIFGYNPNEGSEFLMYDFSKKISHDESPEITLFLERLDGSLERLKLNADVNNDQTLLDGDPLDWDDCGGLFRGVASFTKHKMVFHWLTFLNREIYNGPFKYIEYMGIFEWPLVVSEEQTSDNQITHTGNVWGYTVPGKGSMDINEYSDRDGVCTPFGRPMN